MAKKLNSGELLDVREKFGLKDRRGKVYSDVDMLEYILDRAWRGAKSYELCIAMGLHYGDWDSLREIINRLRPSMGVGIKIMPSKDRRSFTVIREDYLERHVMYMAEMKKIIKPMVKDGTLETPQKILDGKNERELERAVRSGMREFEIGELRKQRAKDRLKAKHKTQKIRFKQFVKSLGLSQIFSAQDVSDFFNNSVPWGKKIIKSWIDLGLCNVESQSETGGRGHRTLYKIIK